MPRLAASSEEIDKLLWNIESSPSRGPIECPECGRDKVFFYESFGGWECSGCKMVFSSRDLLLHEELPSIEDNPPGGQKI